MDLTPGDVWWAAPDSSVGREQRGRRPVVVVSGASYLEAVTTLVVTVPVTTTDRGWPNHVPLELDQGTPSAPSFAMTEQVRTISRERLAERIGRVSPDCLERMRTWIRDGLLD